jgi:glucose-1-phosphate cytidylyltransferase
MSLYASAGFEEFVVALGYKQDVIKDYFQSLYATINDFTVDCSTGRITFHERTKMSKVNWLVHLIDTGLSTMTGGRIKRLRGVLGDETFMCTYGDGLASVDVANVLAFHRREGRLATVTAVRPPARFGMLEIDGTHAKVFSEKPQAGEGWINGGFFVFEPAIFDRIPGDDTFLEHEPLASLARDGQLSVYKHDGFFHPMDTLRDKRYLEEQWASGNAPWTKVGAHAART